MLRNSQIDIIAEARAIKEHEKVVILNALDEWVKFSEPRLYPALFIDAVIEISKFQYSVCYAIQRKQIKNNYVFLPAAVENIKGKTRIPEWFAKSSAQVVALYNYPSSSVMVLKMQQLRELSVVVNQELKEYIPCPNTKVYGYLLSYEEVENAMIEEIFVSNEKHQLAVAISDSLYF